MMKNVEMAGARADTDRLDLIKSKELRTGTSGRRMNMDLTLIYPSNLDLNLCCGRCMLSEIYENPARLRSR